jgi:hypothetical protein
MSITKAELYNYYQTLQQSAIIDYLSTGSNDNTAEF